MIKKRISLLLIITITIGFLLLTSFGQAQAYVSDQILRVGMQGPAVTQLQKDLGYLGYKVGSVDGIYGWQTQQAVIQFQKNNGLLTDGIVGPQTAQSINRQINGNTPSRGGIFFSAQDITNLARLVYGEARGEPFAGQVAVAAVALNRLISKNFGNTLNEVIFQPGAFTAVSDGQFYLTPDSVAYEAVRSALKGWDPTGNATYYWNPETATNKWIWSRSIIIKIGNHVFAQ